MGLREVWFFGLQYTDSKGYITWLKLNKKVGLGPVLCLLMSQLAFFHTAAALKQGYTLSTGVGVFDM